MKCSVENRGLKRTSEREITRQTPITAEVGLAERVPPLTFLAQLPQFEVQDLFFEG